jgi:hypothetical protein
MTALPSIVVFVLRSAAVGSLFGLAVAALFVAADIGGLRSLIASSVDPFSPLLLLGLGFATMIGSLYTGTAIMLLPKNERATFWRTLDD